MAAENSAIQSATSAPSCACLLSVIHVAPRRCAQALHRWRVTFAHPPREGRGRQPDAAEELIEIVAIEAHRLRVLDRQDRALRPA